MQRWTCPKCSREFGQKSQGHICTKGLTLNEYFSTAEPWEQPIFDKVNTHLTSLGDVIVDPIAMGIMFKNGPMFCELRAKKKWTAVGFFLRHRLTSIRLSRKVADYQNKYFHVININDSEDIDNEILEWLTEAYYTAGAGRAATSAPSNTDSLAPDDIDDPFGP